MEQRFSDLASYISDGIVMVAPDGKNRVENLNAAIESYREFMGRCKVTRFKTYHHAVTERGPVAIAEYDWDMAWNDQGADHEAKGREVLVLARRDQGWRVAWRTQLPA